MDTTVQKLIFVELRKFSLDTWNSGKTISHFLNRFTWKLIIKSSICQNIKFNKYGFEKHMKEMEFYFNKFKSIRWFCTNKRESSKHMWKFSIQSIGKHINRGSLHSSHKHCFSIWKWRIFWMLEKFKLNCLYVLINFFFSFLFNSFVDFAIKLIVQNNNCFQNKQMFQPKFFSFRKFVLFIQNFSRVQKFLKKNRKIFNF